MSNRIPLSVPVLNGHEWKTVKRCFDTGWISSVGPFVDELEETIAAKFGVKKAVACVNGTAAIHTALNVLGIGINDEVIVPTVTFIAPVNTVDYVGAHPVFMDADSFYNLDVEKTMRFIKEETIFKNGVTVNKKTKREIKAIIVVHVFGNAVDLEPLLSICRLRNIKIIEDATESIGTRYTQGKLKGKFTGAVGDIGCYSFNGNKIISAGGGGMIVTNHETLGNRAKYLTTQAKEDGPHFVHDEVGYNYRLNNIQAALILAQLKVLERYIAIKQKNYGQYKRSIDKIHGLHLAKLPSYARNNYWMYALQVDEKKYGRSTVELLRILQNEGIEARPLWYLNHLQKPFKDAQTYKIENAIGLYNQTLNIPCSVDLTKKDLKRILEVLKINQK